MLDIFYCWHWPSNLGMSWHSFSYPFQRIKGKLFNIGSLIVLLHEDNTPMFTQKGKISLCVFLSTTGNWFVNPYASSYGASQSLTLRSHEIFWSHTNFRKLLSSSFLQHSTSFTSCEDKFLTCPLCSIWYAFRKLSFGYLFVLRHALLVGWVRMNLAFCSNTIDKLA